MHDLNANDWYATVRHAAPFTELPHDTSDAAVGMMSGGYNSEEFPALRPQLVWNRDSDLISAHPGLQKVTVTSDDMIPGRGLYTVVLSRTDAGRGQRHVGKLDEEAVYESRMGDIIALGTSTRQIQEIIRDRMVMAPTPDRTTRLSFWHGEGAGHDYGLSRTVACFAREIAAGLDVKQIKGRPVVEGPTIPAFILAILIRLHRDGPDTSAIINLARLLSGQQAVTGTVPSDQTLIMKRARGEDGGWCIVLLDPFGRHAHGP